LPDFIHQNTYTNACFRQLDAGLSSWRPEFNQRTSRSDIWDGKNKAGAGSFLNDFGFLLSKIISPMPHTANEVRQTSPASMLSQSWSSVGASFLVRHSLNQGKEVYLILPIISAWVLYTPSVRISLCPHPTCRIFRCTYCQSATQTVSAVLETNQIWS
jgi:hypothetical protein